MPSTSAARFLSPRELLERRQDQLALRPRRSTMPTCDAQHAPRRRPSTPGVAASGTGRSSGRRSRRVGEDGRALDDVAQLAHVARPGQLAQALRAPPSRPALLGCPRAGSARRGSARPAARCRRRARAAAAGGSGRRSAGRAGPRAACRPRPPARVAVRGRDRRARRPGSPPSRRPASRRAISSTRSSFTWSSSGISVISSRNSVPPSACSKKPAPAPVGAGEAPALVAEQLALDQGRRDRAAVDRDERRGLAAAELVDRLRPPAPCRCRSRRGPARWPRSARRGRSGRRPPASASSGRSAARSGRARAARRAASRPRARSAAARATLASTLCSRGRSTGLVR